MFVIFDRQAKTTRGLTTKKDENNCDYISESIGSPSNKML